MARSGVDGEQEGFQDRDHHRVRNPNAARAAERPDRKDDDECDGDAVDVEAVLGPWSAAPG
jgi:hypothetical protein